MMIRKKGFGIKTLSDVSVEGMIVIVVYDDQDIAEINYEKGIDQLEIELVHPVSHAKFPLDDFFKTLERAKEVALRCAKEDAENPLL